MRNSLLERRPLAPAALAASSLFGTLAITALASTIVLIMVGSFVRVSGNGLGCPDWPLCYGRAVPPLLASAWVEFSHRLLGGLVGAQIAALLFLAWRHHRAEAWIWRPAAAAAGLLVAQVALGGIHVLNELPRWTGMVHTGVAMAVAGALAVLVAATSPALAALRGRWRAPAAGTRLPALAGVTAAAAYLLVLTGSLVTRSGSSLACPGFPGCGLDSISVRLAPYVTIQMVHRVVALGVGLLIVWLLGILWRRAGALPAARGLVVASALLLALQIGLGITNVLLALPMWSRVLHLGVGASLWATLTLMAAALVAPQRPGTAAATPGSS